MIYCKAISMKLYYIYICGNKKIKNTYSYYPLWPTYNNIFPKNHNIHGFWTIWTSMEIHGYPEMQGKSRQLHYSLIISCYILISGLDELKLNVGTWHIILYIYILYSRYSIVPVGFQRHYSRRIHYFTR